jgi:hypothetical protein
MYVDPKATDPELGLLNSPTSKRHRCCGTVRALRIWLAVLSVLAFIFFVVMVWHVSKYGSDSSSNTSASAVVMNTKLTEWVQAALDTTADPCNDFFTYTCGGWLSQNPLPPDATFNNYRSFGQAAAISNQDMQAVLDDQFAEAGLYFRECRSWAADTDPTLSTRALSSLSNWLSIIDAHLSVSSTSSSTSVPQLWELFGILSGHQLDVGLGPDAPLLPASLDYRYQAAPLPDDIHLQVQMEKTIAWNSNKQSTIEEVPVAVLANVLDLVQADLTAAGLPSHIYDVSFFPTATAAATAIITLCQQFSNMTSAVPTVTLQNLTTLEVNGKVASRAFLQGLGNHSIVPAMAQMQDLQDWTGYADHIVDVLFLDTAYVNSVLNWLQTASAQCAQGAAAGCMSLATLKATLKSHLLLSLLPTLNDKYSKPIVQAGVPVPWLDGSGTRDFFCAESLSQNFLNVLQSEAWVQAFKPETTQAVTALVNQIYLELGSTLVYNKWMDQETKTKALNKWTLIVRNIMYDST